jgi:hypothetical protein
VPKEQTVTVTVKGKIDLSDVQLDRDVPLRLAAVRDGEVLASTDIKSQKTVNYEIAVPLPFPCGFRLLLGRADVPDKIFMGSELAAVPVSPHLETKRARSAASARAASTTVEAATIAVDAARYQIWIGLCRRFRVHGRVVCRRWRWDGRIFRICDDPVPDATVELYDVDCFWWFCSRDLITTVTTAPDGTFDAEFWWCCRPWLPWWERPWVLDPDLLARIRRLIEELQPHFRIPLPDPPPDPLELQQFVDTLGQVLATGGVAAPPALAETRRASTSSLVSESRIAELLPAPDLVARRVWPWWCGSDCSPDVVFRVTQRCQGETNVVYSETNWQARWDIPLDLGVTLVANDKACCIPICEDPPCGDCLKFGQVGCLPVENIGGNDPLNPVAPDLVGLAYPGSSDIAFARWLSIDGVFGDTADVDYYEIEYSLNGGSFQAMPEAALSAIGRVFWGPPCGGGAVQWNNETFLPTVKQDTTPANHVVYEARRHYEQGCDPGSWGNPYFPGGGRFWTSGRDRILEWVTATTTPRGTGANPPDGTGEMTETLTDPSLVDGLYALRVIGWQVNGAGQLVNPQVMKRCDTTDDEHLLIRLDNRLMPNHPPFAADHPWGPGFVHYGTLDPDNDIVSIVKNEGGKGQKIVQPCDIVDLKPNDTLTIHFFVTVPSANTDRHLYGYWMNAYYGESAYFDMIAASTGGAPQADPTPQVGPTYAQALTQMGPDTRPWWGGGSYKLVLQGSAFPETCAYLFRLHASKRVWSGCESIDWFHYNETETSITINKV